MRNQPAVYKLMLLALALALLAMPFPAGAAAPRQTGTIATLDMDIPLQDIARVEFGMHHSSFESTHTEFDLQVKDGSLTDGKIRAPLAILRPLLSGLRGMLPGTQPLIWLSWTDDYPSAWIYLHLKDGRLIRISSNSQFDGMFPWNVSAWSSPQAAHADEAYIQLRPAFFAGVDALWRGVGEKGFPRERYSDEFWQERQEALKSETMKFFVYGEYMDSDDSNQALVWGANAGVLDPFVPAISRNPEIKRLLDAGYSLYDASLALEVTLDAQAKTIKPVRYRGTLALASPGGTDAVVGLVTIPFDATQPLTTTLKAADSAQWVARRQASAFLNETARLLGPLTFVIDPRTDTRAPTLTCPQNPDITLDGQIIQAIATPANPRRIYFYPVSNGRWAVDLNLRRGDPDWDDALAGSILKAWFPEPLASLPVGDLQAIDSAWSIDLQPNVTLRQPGLLDALKAALPEQTKIHTQNPEKAGDYSFLALDGRVILSEDGAAPFITYCGHTLPEYYHGPYPVEAVTLPDEQAARAPIRTSPNGEWLTLGGDGSLPAGRFNIDWSAIAFSKPGFLHALWSDDKKKGVYYADGWIDGSGWTQPQRLGDPAYWLTMRAWPDGEVHLFWDAGLATEGSVHVWRSPGDHTWHKAEHWPEIDYFSNILRDAGGVLHIGAIQSDGLDGEFMHYTWSAEKGLSQPENISRRTGSTGNASAVLRFDANGRLHAAWSHILEHRDAPDPITGETSDLSGVFYAYRLADGHWSKPRQLGIMAAYAHALSMQPDGQGEPLVIWQAQGGLVSRARKDGTWGDAVELTKVETIKEPAEFGPERWVTPTAELQTVVDSHGRILAGWLLPTGGLHMATWSGSAWTDVVDIFSAQKSAEFPLDPPELRMAIDAQDGVHFTFFKENGGSSYYSKVHYASYEHGKADFISLPMEYDGYGLPETSLAVDEIGSLAILGLPRSPYFAARIPPAGLPPTPTPTPTALPMPTSTPTPTPASFALPGPGGENAIPWVIVLGVALVIIVGLGAVFIMRRKRDIQ